MSRIPNPFSELARRSSGHWARRSPLVNNAGVAYGGPVELLDIEELRRAFEVNFFGVIAVTQAFLPLLRAGRGRIVNMSSISGMVASPFLSPYSTSKWALEALSDAMRVELASWNIHVSVIQPGAINTPIWAKGQQTAARILEHGPKELSEFYGPAIHACRRDCRTAFPSSTSPVVVEHASLPRGRASIPSRPGCRMVRLSRGLDRGAMLSSAGVSGGEVA
jgi:NAD(P)-dependent dehydrogenase (short-subunit alcohol dehydrogenase family)